MEPSLKIRLESALQRIKDEMLQKQKKQPYLEVGLIGLLLTFAAYKFKMNPQNIFGLIGLTGMLMGYLYYQPYLEAKQKFKGFILPKVAESLRSGLKYSPDGTLGEARFERAELFSGNFDEYTEEDEFLGETKGVEFGLREINLVDIRGSGKKRRRVTVFQGVVFNLEFPKNFKGHTHIAPDHVEGMLGGYLGGLIQDVGSSFGSRKRVQLEHPDFERMFVVTSTDEQEARYLITPKMMELVMQFQYEFGKGSVFSFFENHLYIALPFPPIEFPFNQPRALDEAIEKMEHLLGMVDRVVEILELDRNLWKTPA